MEPATRKLAERGTHPWQLRAALSMGVLYLFYYFCKYNLGVATPVIQQTYGFSNQAFGVVVTVFTLVYALGQFINGFLGDRFGPKLIVTIGGFGGVVANLLFGLTPSLAEGATTILTLFILFWGVNAYFSSMGWSPGCRIIFSWFPPGRWGQWIGIYNALCYAGGAIVVPVAGYAVDRWGWRAAFFVSPVFLLAMTVAFIFLGRSSPADAGFAVEWDGRSDESSSPSRKVSGRDYAAALLHPRMNLAYLCGLGGNFVRWGLLSWMVKILSEPPARGGLGIPLLLASVTTSSMHWGGAIFAVLLGVVTDRVFKGKRWQTIMLSYLLASAALFVISAGPALPLPGLAAALFVSGGLVQAVHTPLFSLAGDIMGRELSSTASGIMDGWLYVGASLAGIGLGYIFDSYSLFTGVLVMAVVALCCGLLAILIRR